MGFLRLFHGSTRIIRKPEFGKGRKDNDYGQGFYCTAVKDLACEWACTDFRGGFCNAYELDLAGLRVLDLNRPEYLILHWLSVLLQHRKVDFRSPIEQRSMQYIVRHYPVEDKGVDLMKGCRADDSYFSFARAFLSNTITVSQLNEAMRLGELGEQYCLLSRKSFDKIQFLGAETVDGPTFYARRRDRDQKARTDYNSLLREETDGIYMNDILRGSVTEKEIREACRK